MKHPSNLAASSFFVACLSIQELLGSVSTLILCGSVFQGCITARHAQRMLMLLLQIGFRVPLLQARFRI